MGKTEQQYLAAAGCRINGAAFYFFFYRGLMQPEKKAAQTSIKHTDAGGSVCPVIERFKPARFACAARSAELSSGGPCRDAEDAEEAEGCCGGCGGRTVLLLQLNWEKRKTIVFFSLQTQIVQTQKSTGAKRHPKPSKIRFCVSWVQSGGGYSS